MILRRLWQTARCYGLTLRTGWATQSRWVPSFATDTSSAIQRIFTMNRTTRTWRSSYDERFFLRQSHFLKERVIGKRALVALMFGKGSTVGRRRSGKRNAASVMMLALSPAALLGQNLPASPAEGQKIYAERCVGCHGADARGTDQAPGLAGNPRMRGRSVQKVRAVIRN